jgi:hydroxymethylpyrimidine kinase/phosphomethylpyrimidine kinase
MISGMKTTEGNVHDSSQRYFDGVLAHERDFWRMTLRGRDASRDYLAAECVSGRSVFASPLPHATLVTPNLYEASTLSGRQIKDPSSMESAAKDIAQLGPRAVLIKGGHLSGEATDLLYADGLFHLFSAPRIETAHTHGAGCTYSAAITAELAKGVGLVAAIETAKRYITRAIETNPGLGRGVGPVNHNAQV